MYYDAGGMNILVSTEARELIDELASLDYEIHYGDYDDEEFYKRLVNDREDLRGDLEAQLYWDNEEKADRYGLGLRDIIEELIADQLWYVKQQHKRGCIA